MPSRSPGHASTPERCTGATAIFGWSMANSNWTAAPSRRATVRPSPRSGSRACPSRWRCADACLLITDRQRAELVANGERTAKGECHDPFPVVKLFTPDANATWLLSEIDPEDPDSAFGLCGLGLGCPELGYEITFVEGGVGQIA